MSASVERAGSIKPPPVVRVAVFEDSAWSSEVVPPQIHPMVCSAAFQDSVWLVNVELPQSPVFCFVVFEESAWSLKGGSPQPFSLVFFKCISAYSRIQSTNLALIPRLSKQERVVCTPIKFSSEILEQ